MVWIRGQAAEVNTGKFAAPVTIVEAVTSEDVKTSGPFRPLRDGNELAWHHDDRHGVLFGADLGGHLHAAQLQARRILHDDLRRAAQLFSRFEFRLRLDQARTLLAKRLGFPLETFRSNG
jgi:hypothetical protein